MCHPLFSDSPPSRPAWIPVVFLGILVFGLLAATPGHAEVPKPEGGAAAATTLALLQHQRDVCDAIAGRVLGHWPSLDGQPLEGQQKAIREFVLRRQLSDLAASRTAGDLVDQFLPLAARENPDETTASLRRLAAITKDLCDAIALPTAPQQDFADKIVEWLDRFEFERVELGRLLVVADETLATALEPYLTHIQLAGVEAEGEYLAYLDSIREKPPEPTMKEYMQLWYTQTYRPGVDPVKKALGAYLQARRSQNVRKIGQSCRVLAREAIQVLRNDTILQAPDERVPPLLRPIYIEMRAVATQCTAGRDREVQAHFAAMQEKLSAAAEFLARYELRP